jgi:hypothetical protein
MKAYFVIYGFDKSPEDVSKLLGIQADEIGHKGGERPKIEGKNRPVIQDNYWQINSSSNDEYSIDAHIKNLLKKISPLLDSHSELVEYSKKIVVHDGISVNSPKPGAYIDYATSSLLGRLKIDCDIDLY